MPRSSVSIPRSTAKWPTSSSNRLIGWEVRTRCRWGGSSDLHQGQMPGSSHHVDGNCIPDVRTVGCWLAPRSGAWSRGASRDGFDSADVARGDAEQGLNQSQFACSRRKAPWHGAPSGVLRVTLQTAPAGTRGWTPAPEHIREMCQLGAEAPQVAVALRLPVPFALADCRLHPDRCEPDAAHHALPVRGIARRQRHPVPNNGPAAGRLPLSVV